MILSLDLMILGTVTIIYCSFMTFMGIKTMKKYAEYKDRIFIYAGWGFIGLAIPWTVAVINFIGILLFNAIPPLELWFLVQSFNSAISQFIFVLLNMRLYNLKKKTQTLIKRIYIISWSILLIIHTIILFTDITLMGVLINEIQVDYGPVHELYLLISAIFVVILYLILGRHFWSSADIKIKTKGKLIFFSVLIFIFAVILEVLVPVIPILILARILVMIFAIFFYAGFILPRWAEKIFLRQIDNKNS